MKENLHRDLALVAIYTYLLEDFEHRADREKILTPEFANDEAKLDDFEKYQELLHEFQEKGLIEGLNFTANGKVIFEDKLIKVTSKGENEVNKIFDKHKNK